MIAEVIVDLATNQTDKPFDYQVPTAMEKVIERGSRVIVPFGPRKLLGYIVGFKETTELEKLRPIESLIDEEPALTPELLDLGQWLANETLCFQISAFQAMLPAALKADYKKVVQVSNLMALEVEFPELFLIFQNGQAYEWGSLQKKFPNQLKQITDAIKKGVLETKSHVESRSKVATAKVVSLAKPKDELKQSLEQNILRAPKQRAIIEYFLHQPEPQEMIVQELLQTLNVGRSSIKALVDKRILIESDKEVYRDPYQGKTSTSSPLPLTDE